MDHLMGLNSPEYMLTALGTTTGVITLTTADANQSYISIDNTMGTTPVFVMSSDVTISSITFPSSATVPSYGSVIGPGTVQSFRKNPGHMYIGAIRQSGAADLFVSIGTGA